MHDEMITTVQLINKSTTSHSYEFRVCLWGDHLISISKFQEYNPLLLTAVTMVSGA